MHRKTEINNKNNESNVSEMNNESNHTKDNTLETLVNDIFTTDSLVRMIISNPKKKIKSDSKNHSTTHRAAGVIYFTSVNTTF